MDHMIYSLPFGNETLSWGEERTFELRSPHVGRLKRVVLARDADRLQVLSLIVGGAEQLERDDDEPGLPGQLFTVSAYPPTLVSTSALTFSVTVRATAKPQSPQSFTIAWWVRWFTREGWRSARPPHVLGTLMIETLES
jgi:hypothetical protein